MPRETIRVNQSETVEEVLSKEKHLIPSHHLALDFQPVLKEFVASDELAGNKMSRAISRIFRSSSTTQAKERFDSYPELKASVRKTILSGEFLQKTMVERGETIHSPQTEELLRKLPVRFKHVVVTENGGLEFRARKPGILKRFFNPVIKL